MIAPLLLSSYYSLAFGTASVKDIVHKAGELGWPAIGLSDRGGLYGLPEFMELCTASGIRPIVCAELPYSYVPEENYKKRILAVVIERRGFSRLCQLLSHRAEPGFELCTQLKENHAGLALASDDEDFLRSVADSYALLMPSAKSGWKKLLATGRRPLASGEVRFMAAEDRELQRLLMAIKRRCTVWDIRPEELSDSKCLLPSPEAFVKSYSDVPEAISFNKELLASVKFSSLFNGFIFPSYEPELFHKKNSANSEASLKKESGAELLERLAYEGAKRLYGQALDSKVTERLEYELKIINSKGFCDYFLTVKDIVACASRSCGRGSAAASLVAFCLGITNVDPIQHGLYFDRFLNPGREDPPDIDIDFAWDERDGLLENLAHTYGESRSVRVCNHVRFQKRSATRETARAFGMADSETSNRAVYGPERDKAEPWAEILSLAGRLQDFPQHLGVHSGGVILVPDQIEKLVPIEHSGSNIKICTWDKDGVEAAGLVKIDLLGNRSLAVVRDALANAKENGIAIDETGWRPTEDPETIELLARGDSMGVFYVESPAMRLLQKKTGKGDFEHLVIHSSIIRPAANSYINEYIERLKGKAYKPIHPILGDLFSDTYGILCYQEDVCKLAIAAAGFSSSEADAMRKTLSKRNAVARLGAFKQGFTEGALARGLEPEAINELWAMILSFSGYSFVKAHSASYAMLSFQAAYLRRHRPAEFMAAVISNMGGYYSTLAYASEARRMGIELLPPDINKSDIACKGKGRSLRFGLGMIGALEHKTVQAIIEARSFGGPFRNLYDLINRVKIDRTDAEALVGSGALDELDGPRPREAKLMALLSAQSDREGFAPFGQGELFTPDEQSSSQSAKEQPIQSCMPKRALSPIRRMEGQMRYLGTSLEAHPLYLYPELMKQKRCLGKDLHRYVGRTVRLLAWPIAGKSALTSTGEEMKFVSFEDETALYETVFFPEAYRRFESLLYTNCPLFIIGRVEKSYEAISITVEKAELADKRT